MQARSPLAQNIYRHHQQKNQSSGSLLFCGSLPSFFSFLDYRHPPLPVRDQASAAGRAARALPKAVTKAGREPLTRAGNCHDG